MLTIKLAATVLLISAVAVISAACDNATTGNANANANTTVATTSTPVISNINANANNNRAVAPTREDYERNKDKYAQEAKESGRTIGTGVSDGWLWVKARYELAAADDLRDSTINVDLEHGVATLTGTVPTAAQKTKAEQVTKTVEGITAVKNQIKVADNASATPSPKKMK